MHTSSELAAPVNTGLPWGNTIMVVTYPTGDQEQTLCMDPENLGLLQGIPMRIPTGCRGMFWLHGRALPCGPSGLWEAMENCFIGSCQFTLVTGVQAHTHIPSDVWGSCLCHSGPQIHAASLWAGEIFPVLQTVPGLVDNIEQQVGLLLLLRGPWTYTEVREHPRSGPRFVGAPRSCSWLHWDVHLVHKSWSSLSPSVMGIDSDAYLANLLMFCSETQVLLPQATCTLNHKDFSCTSGKGVSASLSHGYLPTSQCLSLCYWRDSLVSVAVWFWWFLLDLSEPPLHRSCSYCSPLSLWCPVCVCRFCVYVWEGGFRFSVLRHLPRKSKELSYLEYLHPHLIAGICNQTPSRCLDLWMALASLLFYLNE